MSKVIHISTVLSLCLVFAVSGPALASDQLRGFRAGVARGKAYTQKQLSKLTSETRGKIKAASTTAQLGFLSYLGTHNASVMLQPGLPGWQRALHGAVTLYLAVAVAYNVKNTLPGELAQAFPKAADKLDQKLANTRFAKHSKRGRRAVLEPRFKELRTRARRLEGKVAAMKDKDSEIYWRASSTLKVSVLGYLARSSYEVRNTDERTGLRGIKLGFNKARRDLARAINDGDAKKAERKFARVSERMDYVEYLVGQDAGKPKLSIKLNSQAVPKTKAKGKLRFGKRAKAPVVLTKREVLERVGDLLFTADKLQQKVNALPQDKGRYGSCKTILAKYILGLDGLGRGSKLYYNLARGDLQAATKALSTLEKNMEQLKQDVRPGSGWISGYNYHTAD